MKALAILFTITLTVAVWGCSDQSSVIESTSNTMSFQDRGTPINPGEVLVDEVVYSTSLKSSYRVSGTLIYHITSKGPDRIVATDLALSVENENPAKNEAYTLTTTHEQELNVESNAPWFVSESHPLGENPSATDRIITLTYAVNEEGLSIIQIQIEGTQIGNHW